MLFIAIGKEAKRFKAGCWKKKAFSSRSLAKQVVKQMQKQPHVSNPHLLEVYKCEFCGSYHIGHRGKL